MLAVVGVCLLALLLAGMLLLALLLLGPATVVLVPLAALPVAAVVTVVWLLDRWDPRPGLLVTLCLLWGAAASVVMTLVLGLGAEIAFALALGGTPDLVGAVVLAPIFEETTKAALLLIIALAARRHFDGPFQGLLYGSLIGIGFAFTEDILYMGMATLEGGAMAGGMTFFVRGVLTPFAHVAFTGAIGMIMGYGARRPGAGWTVAMFFAAVPVGMALHGVWNLLASAPLESPLWMLLLSAAMGAMCFAGWLGAALLLRGAEVHRTAQALQEYVRSGWLSPAEAQMLGSWAGRRRARSWAARVPGARPVMQRMIRTSALLAAVRHRIRLAPGAATSERVSEARLLEGFAGLRTELLRLSAPRR